MGLRCVSPPGAEPPGSVLIKPPAGLEPAGGFSAFLIIYSNFGRQRLRLLEPEILITQYSNWRSAVASAATYVNAAALKTALTPS